MSTEYLSKKKLRERLSSLFTHLTYWPSLPNSRPSYSDYVTPLDIILSRL